MKLIPDEVIFYRIRELHGYDGVDAVPLVVLPKEASVSVLRTQIYARWNQFADASWAAKLIKQPKIVPNEPIPDVAVVSVNKYTNIFRVAFTMEGAQYQAEIPGTSTLDILKRAGAGVGGKLHGPLVWAVSNTRSIHMNLIPVGSDVYKDLKGRDVRGAEALIKKRDLREGYMYRTKGNMLGIYLGRVNLIKFVGTYTRKDNWVLSWQLHRNRMLWFESCEPDIEPADLSSYFVAGYYEYFTVKQKHSYRVSLCRVCTPNLDELTRRVRRKALAQVRKDTNRISLRHHSTRLTVYPLGTEPTVSKRLQNLIRKCDLVIIPPGATLEDLPELLAHEHAYVRQEAQTYYKQLKES